MKRLTINHIAAASLRSGKKAYISLAAGIFLSIFLVTSMCLGVQGIYLAQKKAQQEQIGRQEIILMENEVSDERLMSEGHFAELGHVSVTAQIEKTGKYVGFYDETAADMLSHRCMEGRLPERAGEIALERSVIEQSRMEVEIGDTISLSLTPIGGVQEERTFTLVGILSERSEQLQANELGLISGREHPSQMPAALIHPDEPPFVTGRVSVIRVMTLSDSHTLEEVILAWTRLENGNLGNLYDAFYVFDEGITTTTHNIRDLTAVYVTSFLSTESLMLILMGISLLIASGIGIAQAMSSRLAHRSEEIGMLRAVGATKRQIRKIFGRESWILTLILTPFSVAAGCFAAWSMARLFPENIIFAPTPDILIPIILLSGACIMLSSRLPLRRASCIMPMSVIRNTAVLRKAKRIKPRMKFKVPNLISGRMLTLYPSRQFGSIALISLMLVCVMLAGFVSRIDAGGWYKDQQAAFTLMAGMPPKGYGELDYITVITQGNLTDQDMAQMANLSQVESVRSHRSLQTVLMMDEPHEYFMGEINPVFHLLDESYQPIDGFGSFESHIRSEKEAHREMQQFLDTDKLLIPYDVSAVVITQQQADALGQYVVGGKIDLEAINAGREVLVLAPSLYYYQTQWGTYTYSEDPSVDYVSAMHNDAFYAGQTLDFVQISCEDEEVPENYYNLSERQIAQMSEVMRGSVKVGAVLDHSKEVSEIMGVSQLGSSNNGRIITTEQGLRAMGLRGGWLNEISVQLFGEVDAEMEQYLVERIQAISMRGTGYFFQNYLASIRREEQQKQQLVLCFGCMALVFLIVSISMIAGNVSRRIRADERMIGTLRAVGANGDVLKGCYSRQVNMSLLCGLLIGGIAACICVPMLEQQVYSARSAVVLSLSLMIAFAGVCAGVCRIALAMGVRAVMRRSIVENIREL